MAHTLHIAGQFRNHNNQQYLIDINFYPLSALSPINCISCVMVSQIKEEGYLLKVWELFDSFYSLYTALAVVECKSILMLYAVEL